MCDQDTENDAAAAGLSRRGFGALAAGAFAAGCATAEQSGGVVVSDVVVTTPDGAVDAHFAHPGRGRHPAVVMWPDIRGLRPAFAAMARRLAGAGYAVLVVNQFYRTQKPPLLAEGESFQTPAVRERLMGMMRALTPAQVSADAAAFIGWLDRQDAVDPRRKAGVAGYCMGGPIVMRAAAAVPERIGAVASFHGASLANEQPESPHLLLPRARASFLIAIAENDDQRTPQEKDLLRAAFAAASLTAEIEVYAGALHGWCPPDSPVYNEAQAERAWSRMLALFGTALA